MDWERQAFRYNGNQVTPVESVISTRSNFDMTKIGIVSPL